MLKLVATTVSNFKVYRQSRKEGGRRKEGKRESKIVL